MVGRVSNVYVGEVALGVVGASGVLGFPVAHADPTGEAGPLPELGDLAAFDSTSSAVHAVASPSRPTRFPPGTISPPTPCGPMETFAWMASTGSRYGGVEAQGTVEQLTRGSLAPPLMRSTEVVVVVDGDRCRADARGGHDVHVTVTAGTV